VKLTRKRTESQLVLETHLDELGLYWDVEFKFHPTRKWKSDYHVSRQATFERLFRECLVEIEGAVYAQGRHTRGSGYEKDCCKYNEAQLLGYPVFRFTTRQALKGEAREFLRRWREKQ